MKKYEFTGETKERNGITLRHIRALTDFSNIEAGDLGGWIEKEENLSHDGNCWIADEAYVYGNAQVYDNARVYGSARVYDNARVYGSARVYDNAQVLGNAQVYENAHVYGYTRLCDYAWVYGNAQVYEGATLYGRMQVHGDARLYGKTQIFGNAYIRGEARVYGEASVFDNASVGGNAVIAENMFVQYSKCDTDLSMNLVDSIRCQTGLQVFGNYVIAFKHVREDLSSLYDQNFKYVVGEWVEAIDPNMDKIVSCASGLHVSNATYWENQGGKVLLMCKVMLEDIITVQQGKIRCKKLYVMDSTSERIR